MWINYNGTSDNINTDFARSISKTTIDGVPNIRLDYPYGTIYLKFISEASRDDLFDQICSSNVAAILELVSVDGTPPDNIKAGDKSYDPDSKLIYTLDSGGNWVDPVEPTSSAIYVCTEDMHMYRWTGSAMIDTTQYLSYATKDEAQLGIDNIKVMTSKRVSEAIDYQIGLCETASNGRIKTVSLNDFSLSVGAQVRVRFINSNSVRDAIEINIAGTGVKPLLINGLPSSYTNYEIPASTYLLKYDGTNWNIITQAALPINLGGTNAVNVNDALKNLIQDAQAIIEDSDLTLPVLSIKSTVSEGAKILVSDLITKYKAILSDLTSISTVTDKIVTPDTISQVIKAITDDINDIGDLLDNTIEDLSDLLDDFRVQGVETIRKSTNFTLGNYTDGKKIRIANTHATNTITCTLPSGQKMNGNGTISIPAGRIIDIELIGATWKDNLTGNLVGNADTASAIKPLGNAITLPAVSTSVTKIIKIGTADVWYDGSINIVCRGANIEDGIKVHINGETSLTGGIRVIYGKNNTDYGIKKIIVTRAIEIWNSDRSIYAEIVTSPNNFSTTTLGVVETDKGIFIPSMTEVSSVEGTVLDSLPLDYLRGDISSYQHVFTKNIIGNVTGNASTASAIKPLGNSIALPATPTSETKIIKIATVDWAYAGSINITCNGIGLDDGVKVGFHVLQNPSSGLRVIYGKSNVTYGIKKIIVTTDTMEWNSNRQIYAEIVTVANNESYTTLGVVETNRGTFTPSMTEVSSVEGTVVDSLSLNYLRGDISSYQHVFTKPPIIPFSTKTGTSTGSQGQMSFDASYLYLCTATNVWKRVALTSF
jgi:hypothetical protein